MQKRIIEHLLLQNLGAFLLLLSLVACTSEQGPKKNTEDPRGELIYARSQEAPIILCKTPKENSLRSAIPYSVDQYIGFTYNPEHGIIGDQECFKRQIFDIDRFEKENPRGVEILSMKDTKADYNVFASSESLIKNIVDKYTSTHKVGFDIVFFKIGYEKTFSRIFHKHVEYQKNQVRGVLNVLCQDARYTLDRSPRLDNVLRHKYLSKSFLDSLYNRPFDKLFSTDGIYSPSVITRYIAGGKADVLFEGTSKKNVESTSLEEDLRETIEASIHVSASDIELSPKPETETKSSYSRNQDDDRDDHRDEDEPGNSSSSNQSGETKNFNTLKVSYRTIGGGHAMAFSAPMKYGNLKVDLTPWVNSLNDKSTHVLIDIPDGGFTPISEFIQEENFRKRIEYKAYNTSFSEPYIEIRLGDNDGIFQSFYEPTPSFPYKSPQPLDLILHTRHGDEISLRPIHENDKSFWQAQYEDEYNRKVKEIADYAHRYYNLDIRKTYYKSAMLSERVKLASKAKFPHTGELGDKIQKFCLPTTVHIALFGLKEGQLKRCKHPYYYDEAKGLFMQYLYFVEGNKRYAFAIYEPYILDTYGLRKLFENAKEEALSIHDLRHFRIIGL